MARSYTKALEMLACVERLTVKWGYAPTPREVADALGIRNRTTIQSRVRTLIAMGHVERMPTRGLRILKGSAASSAPSTQQTHPVVLDAVEVST